MGGMTLVKNFSGLGRFFVCALLLLVMSLTASPVLATMDSNGNQTDEAMAAIMEHMEMMEKKSPSISDRKEEIVQDLNNGTVTPKAACSRCHTPAQGAP
jgi:hypothetical protein